MYLQIRSGCDTGAPKEVMQFVLKTVWCESNSVLDVNASYIRDAIQNLIWKGGYVALITSDGAEFYSMSKSFETPLFYGSDFITKQLKVMMPAAA